MQYNEYDLNALMNGPLPALYCCIGDPVAGNPTQFMIEKAFEALSLPYRYLTMNVSKKNLGEAVRGLKALGFCGYNITSPHKVSSIEFLDELTPSASLSNAVNCVYQKENKSIGDNTDGKGFLTAVSAQKAVKGMNVLVFGSGGASRAIVCELALQEVASITIVNRNVDSAKQLQQDIQHKVSTKIKVLPLGEKFIVNDSYDLIVQATSVGLFDETGRLPLVWEEGNYHNCIASDVVFNPINTLFLQEAKENGCTCVDGLGMLVFQGAIAFEQWTGKKAPIDVMKDALLEAFSDKGI